MPRTYSISTWQHQVKYSITNKKNPDTATGSPHDILKMGCTLSAGVDSCQDINLKQIPFATGGYRLQLWAEKVSSARRKYQSSDVFLLSSAGVFWKLCG